VARGGSGAKAPPLAARPKGSNLEGLKKSEIPDLEPVLNSRQIWGSIFSRELDMYRLRQGVMNFDSNKSKFE